MSEIAKFTTMDEDRKIPHNSVKNDSMSVVADVSDSVNFKEGALHSSPDGSSVKRHGSTTRANCKIQQGAVFSGNILSFGCSVCKDDSTYSPNDLLKHFRAVHNGILPTYPCDLCCFVTHEFAALQRHRIEHKNTLVTCELCCDGVQYSLLLLTRHYIMCHSLNGKFYCDWCEFTTVDAGTFVQHIHHHNESPWKCSKCRHVSLNEVDHQKHLKVHTVSFPFICQMCGYHATTMKQLQRHTVASHKNESERTNQRKTSPDGAAPPYSSPSSKPMLKKSCEVQEAQMISKLCGLTRILPHHNGTVKPETFLQASHRIIGRTPGRSDECNKGSLTAEKPTPVMLQQNERSASSDCASPTNPNALTVLRVKNKISLPPNCTTKVMGFKMVDGKKHIVLKVIPTAKQNTSPRDNASVESVDSSTTNSASDKSEDFFEKGHSLAGKSSASYSPASSPISGSSIPTEDIMAVKVKVEDEETSVCTVEPPLLTEDLVEQGSSSANGSSTSNHEALHLTSNNVDHVSSQNSQSKIACSEMHLLDSKSTSCTISTSGSKGSNTCAGKFTDDPLNVSQELLNGKPTCSNIENCGAAHERVIPQTGKGKLVDKHKNTSSFNITELSDQSTQSTVSTKATYLSCEQNCQKKLANLASLSEIVSFTSFEESATLAQSSLNQKVFAFHNYSKEAFSTSLSTCQKGGSMSEVTADKDRFSLAESSETFGDGDFGADADDSPFDGENSELVLKDFNVIKIEEEIIPISSQAKSTLSALGSFVKQHSDAIITQQLNKERVESSSVCSDSSKKTKDTPQIVQMQELKQQVLLSTNDHFAMPVQLKTSTGFKLITNCINPQINVSYMKSGFSNLSNSTGESVPPQRQMIGTLKAGANEKGTRLISAVQTGVSASPNHYLINSPNSKSPVLSAAHPTDRLAQTQPTCYFVPRSVPFVQATRSSGLKLANAKLPQNSRSVLAMPVSSANKPSNLHNGHQAFLLRCISQSKSSVLVNQEQTQSCQTSEKRGNKIVFKIVSPTTSLLKSGTPSSSCQPFLLATTPPTPCFLMSSNKTNANASDSLKKTITMQNPTENTVKDLPPQLMVGGIKSSEADKPILAPRPIRPPSQRKRRRKTLFDELPATAHKARRLTNNVQTEKEATVLWNPIAKAVERTLRLAPFNCRQEIICPRRYQPVVVLNHPDADIPEVTNIMKVINRHRGAVAKVSLSRKTMKALSELHAQEQNTLNSDAVMQSNHPRPIQSLVRERFLLKLKLKKKSKKKYEVVEPSSCRQKPAVFDCWFCGRLFSSQEDWIGHGQRHLMEATRDWNKLF
ncbi:zinc finger protein 518A-like [Dunckerocampus dactyliophorus]|uniref:zinc finger protein 518A-like n=1 Tax=Dunckerocampus dactyliophorus TaxID=161453 RepID=UPI0024058657|nr:zinc finger protein 518A-like [Dunckerocampus dactyliophorus]XP_054624173.1 zinc finger protein 518A-like [Dunckerocampus dactyliophorus]